MPSGVCRPLQCWGDSECAAPQLVSWLCADQKLNSARIDQPHALSFALLQFAALLTFRLGLWTGMGSVDEIEAGSRVSCLESDR